MRGPRAGALTLIIDIFVFLFGIVIGSFLNVCILRIPEDVSIVAPRSKCPSCGAAIQWYDNVPVFAWLWLRGKCRTCQAGISPMYPLVELATGLLFVACYEEFGVTRTAIKWLFLTCLLIVLTITDLRARMLPDLVNWPGFAIGLFFAAAVPTAMDVPLYFFGRWSEFLRRSPEMGIRMTGLANGILGAAFGSLLLWGVAALYKRVRGREGMGLGDVKMMAMVGAFLGIRGAFLTILLGTLLGSIVGVATIVGLYGAGWHRELAERASRRGLGTVSGLRWAIASQYQLPLGTFLGIAALAIVYLNEPIGKLLYRMSPV